MGVLSEDDVTRLVKLLGMMGSTHDGEVRNAAQLAQRLVASLGLTWEDVFAGNGGGYSEEKVAQLVKDSFDYGFEKGRAQALNDKLRVPQKLGEELGSWRFLTRALLDDYRSRLTPWEVDFCEGFLDRGWPRPTPKQQAVFEKIANKCNLELPE